MRQLRTLKQGVWCEIRALINNREPLFRRYKALALFASVFRETERRFAFRIRGLRLEDDRLEFYIRPEDGGELPAIMKRLKQVFAQQYNREEGRIGRIWGDRYWSRIVEGEPAEEEGETGGQAGVPTHGVRPRGGRNAGNPWFPLVFPFPAAPAPGQPRQSAPHPPVKRLFRSAPEHAKGKIRPETGGESALWVKCSPRAGCLASVAVNKVNDISAKNKMQIETLLNEASRFKVALTGKSGKDLFRNNMTKRSCYFLIAQAIKTKCRAFYL